MKILLLLLTIVSCGHINMERCDYGECDDEAGPAGEPGPEGKPGVAGTAGQPGKPGSMGEPGRDGQDGVAGEQGAIGETGANGASGQDGRDGAPGLDGTDGTPGQDGQPGNDGQDGDDGSSCSVQPAIGGVLISCTDGTQAILMDGTDGQDAPPTPYTVTELVDPCGDGPGYDEVLMRLANGQLVAHFASGALQFLTMIGPGSYATTDQQACQFTVQPDGSVTW